MLKVVAENAGAFYQHYPRTVAIVTVSYSGRKNAMAAAWHSPVSFNPAYYGISIAPKRYTYQMIIESKQFGINFITFGKSNIIAKIGGSSGGLTYKFTEFNIAEDLPIKTEVPILKDAYAAYECNLVDYHIYGDHAWVVGDIVASHMAGEAFDEDGILDLNNMQPSLYLGAEIYCGTDSKTQIKLDRKKYGNK
jgi:flavin reductase (DIM6/NTAB) family NADH-FMN oxidoreductase RutF